MDAKEAKGGKQDASSATQASLSGDMRFYSTGTAIFAIAGLLCMIVQNEIAWQNNVSTGIASAFCTDARNWNCDPRDAFTGMFPVTNEMVTLNMVRGLGISATTLGACIMLYWYYLARLRHMKSKNQVPPTVSLLTSPLLLQFIVELAVLCIHVFPGIDGLTDAPALYLWMSQFMFVRCLFVVRAIIHQSSLNSSNGRFISALTNVEFDASFVLKTVLKDRPIVFMTSILAILMVSSAYAVRVIESLTCSYDRSLGCMPISFEDSLWFVVVTMLTIGYGDITAKTAGGRFVILAGGVSGTLVLAATVALMADSLQLSRSESKVVAFLRKHDYKQRVTNAAALVIQTAFRLHTLRHGIANRETERALLERLSREAADARDKLRHGRSSRAKHWWNCCQKQRSASSPWKQPQPTASVVPVSQNTPATPLQLKEGSNLPLMRQNDIRNAASASPAASFSNGASGNGRGGLCCRKRRNQSATPLPDGAAMQAAVQPRDTSRDADIHIFERLLFQRIEAFRTVKRFVLSHDPTDPVDRQLTLLETLEVSVDEIRSNVEILSDFLLGAGTALATQKTEGDNEESQKMSASRSNLVAMLTPAAQMHLAKIAAEKTGKSATGASRVIASAIKPASSRDLSARKKFNTSPRGSDQTMDLETPNPFSSSPEGNPHPHVETPSAFDEDISSTSSDVVQLRQIVRALTSQLAGSVDALTTMQASFADYKRSTDAKLLELQQLVSGRHGVSPVPPLASSPSPSDFDGDRATRQRASGAATKLPMLSARGSPLPTREEGDAYNTLDAVLGGDDRHIRSNGPKR